MPRVCDADNSRKIRPPSDDEAIIDEPAIELEQARSHENHVERTQIDVCQENACAMASTYALDNLPDLIVETDSLMIQSVVQQTCDEHTVLFTALGSVESDNDRFEYKLEVVNIDTRVEILDVDGGNYEIGVVTGKTRDELLDAVGR